MFGIGDHKRLYGLDLEKKMHSIGFKVDLFSIENITGNYIDRNVESPHVDSDKYLFLCKKVIAE